MPLIKFSSTDDFKSDVEPVSIITDPKQLTKRFASEKFKHVKIAKDQTPVHVIAVSPYQSTGYNRNLDAFDEKDCRDLHHTFVKAGRAIHYNHKNSLKDPKFGDIYSSAYNEPMKRIELLFGLDNDNPRNEKTLNKLAEGKQICVSMASRQDHDFCSLCKHKSYNGKTDRCEHIPSRLGEITKEGKIIGMHNPSPNWFELSIVERPAERIAYSLNKTASDNDSPQSRYEEHQKLAEEIYIPSLNISIHAANKRALLSKLAKIEKRIEAISAGKVEDSKDKFIKEQASKLNAAPILSDRTISELRKFDHNQLLTALANKGVIFTPEEFAKYLFDNKIKDHQIDGMKSHLPDIFENLSNNDEELNSDDYQPAESKIPSDILDLIKDLVPDHSIFGQPAHARIMRITIIKKIPGELKKESSVKSDSIMEQQLAIKYANYKLSALNYLNELGKLDDELLLNSLIQNRR